MRALCMVIRQPLHMLTYASLPFRQVDSEYHTPRPKRLLLAQTYQVHPEHAASLHAIMYNVAEQDVLQLQAGTYYLHRTLQWKRGMSLIGASKETTELTCALMQSASHTQTVKNFASVSVEQASMSDFTVRNCVAQFSTLGSDVPAGVQISFIQYNCPVLTNLAFFNMAATGSKGAALAVKNCGCQTVVTGSDFGDGQAYLGGAIYAEYADIKLEGCSFANNSAATAGGVIYATLSAISVTGCNLTDNTALQGAGGAMYLLACQESMLRGVTISSSHFSGNMAYAGSGGGAISSYLSDLSVTSSSFEGNKFLSSSGNGGAILADGDGGSITVSSTQGTSNEVENGSGGFLAMHGVRQASVTGCTFTGNSASNAMGGGVAMLSVASIQTASDHVTITTTMFDSNKAQHGGGFAEYQANTASILAPTLEDCVFTRNSASTGGGGAIFHLNAAPTLTCSSLGVSVSSPAIQCTGTQSNDAGAPSCNTPSPLLAMPCRYLQHSGRRCGAHTPGYLSPSAADTRG